jgi:hypothetical protein
MRLAIVSTPRSGNMWLRRLLRATFDLEEFSVHSSTDLDWENLPEHCVVQLHAHHTPEIVDLFAQTGFRIVCVVRHPLDVLISILHFARHEPATALWLEGEYGDERLLSDADPLSEAFLAYATSARAQALLAVSREWLPFADAIVWYEDLVHRPDRELARLAARLAVLPAHPPAEASNHVTFSALREEATNLHFWRGRPEGWRSFLTPDVARRIAAAHAPHLEALGYAVDADDSLDTATAAARWAEAAQPVKTLSA